MPPELNLQRRAAEECRPGEVLVIDCRGNAQGASGGLVLSSACACGVAPVSSRMAACATPPTSSRPGFPVYAKAVCPPNSLVAHRFVDLQVPVTCGEAAVYPGDYIVGDPDGVIVVPADIAAEVAEEAAAYEDKEEFIIRRIRTGASVYGTYPLTGRGAGRNTKQRSDD